MISRPAFDRLPRLAAGVLAALILVAPPVRAGAGANARSAPPDTADAGLLAAVRAQVQGGQAALAVQQLAPRVDAFERAPGPATARGERILQAWCEALGRSSLAADSAAYARARRSIELSTALHGPRAYETSTSQMNLGRLYLRARKNVGVARALVDSAVAIRRSAVEPDSLALAAALVLAGRAARECDDLEASQRCADEVYAIRARLLPPGHLDLATALNNRAIIERARGDLQGAYRDSRAATEIIVRKLPPSHPNVTNALNTLGITALLAGDELGGIEAFQKAIAGMAQATPPDSASMAGEYSQLALAYRDLGDYSRAIETAVRAVGIIERTAPSDSFALRNTLLNRGEVERSAGDFAAARATFARALAIERARPQASSEGMEVIELNLGELQREAGRPDSALTHFDRVASLRAKRLGPDRIASILVDRALAWHALGQADSARTDLSRAIAQYGKYAGPDAIATVTARMVEARFRAEAGDSATAFGEAMACEEVARARVRGILRYVSERQALAFAKSRPQSLDLVLSLAARHGRSFDRGAGAWDCLVRSRGLALDEFAARQADLREESDSVLANLEHRRYAAQQRVANLALAGARELPDAASGRALASAAAEVEQLEQELARRLGRPETAAPEPGVSEVRAALPAGSALVAYVRWNDESDLDPAKPPAYRYGAWIASAGEPDATFLDLGPGAAVDSLVRSWRAALAADRTGSERDRGARLARRVWDPVRGRIPSARRVYLVPDGSLNDVAWYALPAGKQRLLDQDVEIRLLSSERDLLEPARVDAGEALVLVVGGADFEAQPGGAPNLLASADPSPLRSAGAGCGEFALRRFGALPFSAREARSVSAAARGRFGAGSVRTLVGADATEANFVAVAPAASWIHGATHGFYLDPACRDRLAPAGAELDPLLFSGVALAGANRRGEAERRGGDGLVTAGEFAALDLSRVDGMVVTGCNTGLGEYVGGEGVFGMRRALERAGVRQLALALWPLDDQAAERWSVAFYDGLWNRGLQPATAGRDAMRKVRAELRAAGLGDAPRRWGGMAVSGP